MSDCGSDSFGTFIAGKLKHHNEENKDHPVERDEVIRIGAKYQATVEEWSGPKADGTRPGT